MNNERQDSSYDGSRWDSTSKDGDDGLSNFPGAKIQNSPGKEAFPGGWGSGGSGGGGNGWSDSGGDGGGGGGWGGSGGNSKGNWGGSGASNSGGWGS